MRSIHDLAPCSIVRCLLGDRTWENGHQVLHIYLWSNYTNPPSNGTHERLSSLPVKLQMTDDARVLFNTTWVMKCDVISHEHDHQLFSNSPPPLIALLLIMYISLCTIKVVSETRRAPVTKCSIEHRLVHVCKPSHTITVQGWSELSYIVIYHGIARAISSDDHERAEPSN